MEYICNLSDIQANLYIGKYFLKRQFQQNYIKKVSCMVTGLDISEGAGFSVSLGVKSVYLEQLISNNKNRCVLQMEENLKVVQLKGLPNNQLIDQIRTVIGDREVDKLSIFITFKQKKQKPKPKMEKNLQQKTYEALNMIKEKKTYQQTIQNMKNSFKANCKVDVPLVEQISRLYQLGEYEKVISTLIPKQAQLQLHENQTATEKETEKNKNQYNFITFSIGNCYFRLKNYPKAIEYYLKTNQEEPSRQHAQRLNNLGTCYAIKNSYQQALKAYNEAIKYYNESPEEDVSSLLNNIAMIYLKCQMYKTAEQFFIQSINERKVKSPNNKVMLYNSYYNLGVCQKKTHRLEECLNNLFIAFNYACDGFGKKIDVLNEICLVYEQQNKWSQTLSYYEKLSEEYEKLRKPQGTIYERVSKIHDKLGNSLMAARYAKKAFKLYNEQGNQRKASQLSGSPLVNIQNTI